MPAPPSSVSRDEPWRKARGTQVLGMTLNGTVSRSPATSELAALVALAYPDPMPSSERPLQVKPARRPRKRPLPSAAKARREQRVTSEQALLRALRVSPLQVKWETLPKAPSLDFRESALQDKLERKPMKLQSLYQAWLRVARWAKSQVFHPSGVPAWKRRHQLEMSPPASSPSSSSVRTRTKATKSALKSGKTSKKRGRGARGN